MKNPKTSVLIMMLNFKVDSPYRITDVPCLLLLRDPLKLVLACLHSPRTYFEAQRTYKTDVAVSKNPSLGEDLLLNQQEGANYNVVV